MPAWPALLLSPMLALAEQSIVYALSTPACQTQREAWLHGVPLLFVALTLLLTAMAWTEARRQQRLLPNTTSDADGAQVRHLLFARLGVASAALSSLVIVAMWIPQWVLSACAS
jgi:hypothetical protein